MACKRSPVRLRHSPPNEIKASEKSGALILLGGLHIVYIFDKSNHSLLWGGAITGMGLE